MYINFWYAAEWSDKVGGEPLKVAPLLPIDREAPRPEAHASPGLHLDERHHPAPARHQVEVVAPQPEAVGLDLPAQRGQVADRLGLGLEFRPHKIGDLLTRNGRHQMRPSSCPISRRGYPHGHIRPPGTGRHRERRSTRLDCLRCREGFKRDERDLMYRIFSRLGRGFSRDLGSAATDYEQHCQQGQQDAWSPIPHDQAPNVLIRCRPTAWLFSGWNWHATTLSFHTAEAKGFPYSVTVAITAGSAGST